MRGYLVSALICAVLGCAALVAASPLSRYQQSYYDDAESEPVGPEQQLLLEILARYGQDLIRSRELDNILTKRGLDFGFNRGHSGTLAAKQLLGMAAANDSAGPGRKRREAS